MDELRLTAGELELVVHPELGGRILALRAFGHDIVRSPADPAIVRDEPFHWGSYAMVPWCNRIPFGRLFFEGVTYRLALGYEGHAIHGRGLNAAWERVGDARIELRDAGDETHPWPYRAWQEFGVTADAVTIRLGVENTGTTRMPAGLGIHPWFDATDPLEVRLPADLVYPSHGNYPLPGDPVPVTPPRDLRRLEVPQWDLDEIWTGLTERRIDLHWPTRGISLAYEFSANCDHVVLATIHDVDAYAIEPQTHATDGHRRREDGERGGIGVLDPGDALEVDYTLTITRDPAG